MRLIKLFITATALLAAIVLSVSADDTTGTVKQKPAPQETPQVAPRELTNQTHCPVMGGKIDSSLFTDIQGQRVYHCCPMCSAKLKADPDKYFKKAAEDGVLFENIQTTCPVSGKKLEEKTAYTDYEGRRIYFCCKKCRGTFNEDPQTFLKKMDQPADQKEQAAPEHDHTDHGDESHQH